MTELKLLQVNDPHTSDRPPRYRTDTYLDDIFAKLEWALLYAKQEKVNAILIPGDLFHIPQATKVSHSLVNRWMRLLDTAPCSVYAVAGNHDLAAGRIESIPKQPLGTLATHPNFVLMEDGRVMEIDNGSHQFTFAGVSWNYGMDVGYIKALVSVPVDLLIIHAMIAPQPSPFYKTISRDELNGVARVIAYGHAHVPEKPYQVTPTLFVNPGALARAALVSEVKNMTVQDDANREPAVALITMTEKAARVEYVTAPCKSMKDAFKTDTHQVKEANRAIDKFVANLGKAEVTSISPEDLLAEASKLTDEPGVRALLEEILLSA